MNRYLATSHVLALLDQPVALADFETAVKKHNPLFAGRCLSATQFLWFLHEEGLLERQEEIFSLSPLGEVLHQHILNWSSRDKQAVKLQKALWQARTQLPPIDPKCPRCASDFCALHLFIVLLEHFCLEQPLWNAWPEGQKSALLQALSEYYAAREPLFLLWETEPFFQWPHWSSQASQGLLQALSADPLVGVDTDTLNAFGAGLSQRWLLRESGQVLPHLQLISRLRYDYGLFAPPLKQQLARIETEAGATGVILRICRPLPLPSQSLLLIYLEKQAGQQASCALLFQPDPTGWQVQQHWRLLPGVTA